MIRFDAKANIVVADDLVREVTGLLDARGAETVALIVDRNVAGLDDVQKLKAALDARGTLLCEEIAVAEPTTEMVDAFADKLSGGDGDAAFATIGAIIGLGGGSTIDLTKALSVMAVHEGSVEAYHGTGKPFERGIYKIMIPTTAGTGAEVTAGAVLVNEKTEFKRAIGGPHVTPDVAVLYAPLTVSMPDWVTVSTGMDALGHAVEAFTTKPGNEVTRMYAREAFRLVFHGLRDLYADPKAPRRDDRALRRQLLLGSCLAGYAIYNSNTGACHSMAYPLGIFHKVPHGIAVASLLPPVVRINVEKGCTAYADLYDLIEGRKPHLTTEEKALAFADALESYPPTAFMGKGLGDFGIDEARVPFLAERGLDLTPALDSNPVPFDLADSERALRATLK